MSAPKLTPLRIAGQVATTALVLGFVAAFANGPAYQPFAPDEALVRVSVTHATRHREACHTRSKEELDKLPPNMRVAKQCSRERVPMELEIEVDGQRRLTVAAKPAGLSKDLAASVYRLFPVPAGSHRLAVRMRDSARGDGGHDFTAERTVDLKPHAVLVVDFDDDAQAFRFRP
jgi:hypothetical protein